LSQAQFPHGLCPLYHIVMVLSSGSGVGEAGSVITIGVFFEKCNNIYNNMNA